MRRRRNMLDVSSWRGSAIDKCSFCNEKAVYHLKFTFLGGFAWGEFDLCNEHRLQWEKGELYI